MAAGAYLQQLGAFVLLVGVQTFAILLFKLCQVNGAYTFSPASSVALTEMCKLVLAMFLHMQFRDKSKPFFENVNTRMVLHYLGLSALYTANNQLSFYVLEVADPGTMSLGKSIAPYLCALLLRLTGQLLHELQWVCVIIQCCAIAIVQYDNCSGSGILSLYAYGLIATATSITAITSVWNQLVIKGFDVPMNLQNAILYGFGSAIAVSAYVWEAHHATHARRVPPFFHGYNALAALLVLFQAFHGLAVALVYKYADAIVKNFANSSVMALLIVISFYFFKLQTSVHSWLGIVIVLTTTYCYMNIALKLPTGGAAAPPGAAAKVAVVEGRAAESEGAKLLEEGEGEPVGRSPGK